MIRNLLTAAFVFVALASQAQPSGGPSPATVPIDGGISVLLAGGVAYTIRRVQQRRRK